MNITTVTVQYQIDELKEQIADCVHIKYQEKLYSLRPSHLDYDKDEIQEKRLLIFAAEHTKPTPSH